MIKWSNVVDVELIMIKINYCCGMPLIHGEMNKAHSYCQAN
jgi:hypothetical protein